MSKRVRKQALLLSVTRGKRGERALEERQLGGDEKMVAPTAGTQESVIAILDEEGDGQEKQIRLNLGVGLSDRPLAMQDGRLIQFIPRLPGRWFVELEQDIEEEVFDYENEEAVEEVEMGQWRPVQKGGKLVV
ncbi:hypothetical protein NDU88_007365 [Pleurodeles waltl]|uniref:Uncharacterized protein n=1 Tax=Pleurodeles waltl TaxID=8319 RepID=A0AAV7N1W4_PLEWA|nr:hypothetical protein NDU88_007365 [Pleurodeles waltl]